MRDADRVIGSSAPAASPSRTSEVKARKSTPYTVPALCQDGTCIKNPLPGLTPGSHFTPADNHLQTLPAVDLSLAVKLK